MPSEIGVIVFGHQGEAWAQNLRDNDWNVRTFFRSDSKSAKRAEALGFTPQPLSELGSVPILALLIPDTVMPLFCRENINNLQSNQSLIFAHGFSLHYRTAPWPSSSDWILVAPKGIGAAVRNQFVAGSGVPAVLAVENDATGSAWTIAHRVAEGIGSARVGVYIGSAREEVEADLFSEQALLCGGLPGLVAETYSLLIQNGISPEIAYLECVHELTYMVDLFQTQGIAETLQTASPTAQFGGFAASRRLISQKMKDELQKMLQEIQKGSFAQTLDTEAKGAFSTVQKDLQNLRQSSLEKVGHKIRTRLHERKV